MTRRRAGCWAAVGTAVAVTAVVLLACPVDARLRQPGAADAAPRPAPPAATSATPAPAMSAMTRPGSSGDGVAVWDPVTRRTVILPPDQAAQAIREYWTRERQEQARPAP